MSFLFADSLEHISTFISSISVSILARVVGGEVREMERARKSLSFLSRVAVGVFLGLDRALKLTLTFVVKNNRLIFKRSLGLMGDTTSFALMVTSLLPV